MFCRYCGAIVHDNAVVCPHCGRAVDSPIYRSRPKNSNVSDRNWIATLLLCIFLGNFGAHRFYAGKMGSAILMLLTSGFCWIWVVVDAITIATGTFTDEEGKFIKE
jgi:TM2 domain-containing membrane protein YozV